MGLQMGMNGQDVLDMPFGLFMDLLACDSISKGGAKQKTKMKKMSFDDFVSLR